MQNNSPTAAGQSKPLSQQKEALVDAINQVFTLFRLNYHNQYLKAFGNTEELIEVKRLWLEMLQKFAPRTILTAAKSIIESTEYLPTLRTMIYHCERASNDFCFPDPHNAYIEACRAPSPKAAYPWSHPVVYHAGKKCDWYFLQSNSEAIAYPVFRRIYDDLCVDVRNGMQLEAPSAPTITHERAEPLDKKASQERLDSLRHSLDL